MSLSEQQVRDVAHLARLELDEAQVQDYAKKLSSILEYIAQMDEVDTKDIEPMAHPLSISQPTRIDAVSETNQRDKMQNIAPATENGLYLVPKVIE